MSTRKHIQHGFTLVEILIVVVILGILAAIVIPQFTNASESAKSSSLISQLQTIRSQLELYQVQHNGDYPTLVQLWDNLTTETEVDGTAGDNSGDEFGPYLQQDPVNGFENTATVLAAGAEAAGVGWTYDAATGEVMAVMEAVKAAEVFPTKTFPGDADIITY